MTTGSCNRSEAIDLSRFKELLLRTCGHSFENEREQALSASMYRRMAAVGIDAHEAYLTLLLSNQAELLRLTELLTVNETYFFREPDHLNLIVAKLLPELIAAGNGRPVRILSAGCSTGEEPYSVAIMLKERYGAESERLFSITAVDIDSAVIAGAKQGVYGNASFRGMDKIIFERYFKPDSQGKFQIDNSIRKQVHFEVVNLLGGTYPSGMLFPDIILYRNVSIYFPVHIQREIFSKLAELLSMGGCLLVGASETIHHDVGILPLVKRDSIFYYHKSPAPVIEERRQSSRYSTTQERPKNATPLHVPTCPTRPVTNQNIEHSRPSAKINIREHFDEAIVLAQNKQYDKALAILDTIIGQDSNFEKAYSLKASLLLNASRFDEARKVCEGILGRDQLCLEAYLLLGIIARQKGDDESAFMRFREAIYLDSSCWLAHFYSAEILFAQQDLKRARNSYETAQKILDGGVLEKHGQAFFPLAFNAEQFIVICRHKLSLLTPIKV